MSLILLTENWVLFTGQETSSIAISSRHSMRLLLSPNLDYCDVVWGNDCHKYISKLNKLLNRAGKTILRVNKRFSTDLMLDCLKWKTLLERRNYHLCVMFHKCIAGQAPSYLCDTLVKVAENSPYCTRGSVQGNLKPPKFSTGSGKILSNTVVLWPGINFHSLSNTRCHLTREGHFLNKG